MFIKSIINFDDDGQEATVIVSDGEYEIMCYAQPFSGEKNISFSLLSFGVGDIVTATDNCYFIKKNEDGYYSYFVRGKLIDSSKGLFQLGNLIIEGVDYAPKDIPNGAFVEFTVIRFDLIEE